MNRVYSLCRSSDQLEIPGARVGASGTSASTGDVSLEDDPPSYASLCEDPPPYSEIVRPVSHAASQTSDPGSDERADTNRHASSNGATRHSDPSSSAPTVTVQQSSPAGGNNSGLTNGHLHSSPAETPSPSEELATTTTIVDGLHETAA